MAPRSKRPGIAIVGMACRFPGLAHTPAEFWSLLEQGKDAVTQIGPERWSTDYYYHPSAKAAGKSYTFAAGVLDDVAGFDAAFFGVSPREAAQMDPQQRLLLEMTWEALEDAGEVPSGLAGSATGVYVGISSTDYANRRLDDPSSGDAYFMTGGTLSIAANRLSYQFDLHGPSMAVDTACSSSMVAIHQACQSLWAGESSGALVGGVNMLLTPFPFIGFSQASMLSPLGRCRAFDANGQGYVRSEGGAMLYLKPLARARADGDRIHAVIVGSACNSDGRTKGLSLPSAASQEALLRRVYEEAGVSLDDVAYLEAHGTGTSVGDPLEAGAIGRAIGQRRNGAGPLPIGSVKTNIGHLEPASGVAGLLKGVLALQHGVVPPSLHFDEPNPDIDFEALNLKVADRKLPLTLGEGEPVVGVNSFGFGGTNAHVVLQRFGGRARKPAARRGGKLPPLLLSARAPAALTALAESYASLYGSERSPAYDACRSSSGAIPAYDIAYSAATRRQHHPHRLAVTGRSAAEVAGRLEAYARDGRAEGVVAGQALDAHGPSKVAFLFSGNGSQWVGMGRALLAGDKVFAHHVGAVDELMRGFGAGSVIDALTRDDASMARTEIAQPALFALQVGLFEVLRGRGLTPHALYGHSVGEVAAAYAAGVYDLESAARIIHERSQAQACTHGAGKMAAVRLDAQAVRTAINELPAPASGAIEVAAVNSPGSVTLSGLPEALEVLRQRLEARGVFFRLLDLDYAFHSRAMDGVRESLLERLEGLRPGESAIDFISTVTGTVAAAQDMGAEYWWRNVRRPVQLDAATATLIERGVRLFVEIGPNPIMQSYVRESLRATGDGGRPIATLRENSSGPARIDEALASAYTLGAELDFERMFPARGARLPLPVYPWQREKHWYESTTDGMGLLDRRREHPLLGWRIGPDTYAWENHVDTDTLPYLADHVVGGVAVFPAAGFIEMALAASHLRDDFETHSIEELEIRSPLLMERGRTRTVRFDFVGEDGSFRIRSRGRLSEDPWAVHVVGRIAGSVALESPALVELAASMRRATPLATPEQHYEFTARAGLMYGPSFQTVAELRRAGKEVWARLTRPDEQAGERQSGQVDGGRYHLHPTVLDGCLQALVALGLEDADQRRPPAYLPFKVARIIHRRCEDGVPAACRVRLERTGTRSLVASFRVLNEAGETVAQLESFRFRRMPLSQSARDALWYRFRPQALPLLAKRRTGEEGSSVPDPHVIGDALVEELTEQWYALDRAGHYAQAVPLFDALTAAFVLRAVRALAGRREQFSLETLAASARVPAERLPLLHWCMALLEEDGLAQRDGAQRGQWILGDPGELSDPLEIWRLLLADFPAYLPEATLAGRAGLHLESVLRGQSEGVAGDDALAYLCDASPSMVPVNRALRHTLAKILADWPQGQRLRVLEVNGGALGLVADLVSVLPPERCDYVYAADSDDMVARATAELEHCPQVRTIRLDLEHDPIEQGLELHGFDIVIAAHCLHAATPLERGLSSLRRLLSRDGVLIALERASERATDLVFGARSNWWRDASSGVSPRSRLRTAEEWRPELERAGFEEALVLSEPAPDVEASCYLVLARNPEARELETDVAVEQARTVLMLSDSDGPSVAVSAALADALHDAGHRPVHAIAGDETARLGEAAYSVSNTAEGFTALLGLLDSDGLGLSDLVHLFGLEPEPDGEGIDHAGAGATLMAIQDARCASTLHLTQALAERSRAGTVVPRLWLVCAGAAPLDVSLTPEIGPRSPAQAPLWGLGRVLMNEHPELQCRLLDLHTDLEPARAARLIAEELRAGHKASAADIAEDDEVVLGAQTRYVLRLGEVSPDESSRSAATAQTPVEGISAQGTSAQDMAVLDFANPGPLSNLQWRHQPRRAPAAGEIQIEVRATGLNFRDVMYAMGMLSDEAVENGFAGASLGLECAGDVVAIGPDVTGFKIGEPVIAFARACFGTYVTTPTTAVAHKPPGWTYEAAATVPSAFFTVYYALEYLARLQPRERVLVHGAAGGVGMAAIQYARSRGAEVFATAGSDTKRDFLHLLGVDHVLDSRSLDFADRIMTLTDGEGVDVVLNSLSGEAMVKSLSVVRPFGRFLELGKRDFYENAKLGLRPFRNNISYFGIDADQLLVERPDLAGRLFRDMMGQFERGAFRPLVHRSFPATRAADAFRHMQQSRHIGKIVIGYDEPPVSRAPAGAAPPALELDAEATYLVTGGLTGFGLATAKWLMAKGARYVALLGRRGMDTPGASQLVADMRAAGVTAEVIAADVTDRDSLAGAMKRIGQDLPPLKGVVHAAMVLDDGVMQNLCAQRLRDVLAPKVLGAWHLHLLTHALPLDFFVMYSSATTAFGNPGQASYVAANLYLETLASHRRGEGLPGQAVAWGPIADVGVLADNEAVREGLGARIGGEALKSADALGALERIIQSQVTGVAVVDLDWRVLARSMPALSAPKFGEFVGPGAHDQRESGGQDVREMLVGLSDEDARDTVVVLLAEQVGKVLRMPGDKLDPELSIYDLGMDSLMAVELHMALEERFGVSVPIMAVTEGATLKQLSARLAQQIVGGSEAPEQAQASKVASLAARHGEDLSEDDVDTIIEDAGRQTERSRLIS